ncbi:MAG TPA: prepilin-type N-terminal cleavage/methylation domain-containing protein [Phycisphaerae bacterium]|nr:prepilin-type N-terminal cleavage/methylation domain-containing protein [Phycisphaerae bacterium]
MNGHCPQVPGSPLRGRAFTLIEVLVVISIIVILLAVSIPTIKALTKGNGEKQAVNLITTLLANARATAISTHKASGVVFYEYPAPATGNASGTNSYAQLITQSGIDAANKVRYFVRVPGTGPQQLPPNIEVATLDYGSNLFKRQGQLSSDVGGTCRVILFDSNGQMVQYNALATDPALSGDQVAQAWNIAGASSSAGGTSSPGFLVYDALAFKTSHDASSSNDNTWLQQNADVLVVNPYTGTVIR